MKRTSLTTALVLIVLCTSLLGCRLFNPAPAEPERQPAPTEPAAVPSNTQPATAVDLTRPVVLAGQQRIEKWEDPKHEINLEFPFIEGSGDAGVGFNWEVDSFINQAVGSFQSQVQQWEPVPDPSLADAYHSLYIRYEPLYNDHGLVSISFETSQFMVGSAHPLPGSAVMNYDLVQKKKLTLEDLFQPGSDYLQVISDYCIQELQKNEWFTFPEGAAPNPENYAHWNVTPDGLQITFDPYLVAAYAVGYVRVTVPYDVLRPLYAGESPLLRVK